MIDDLHHHHYNRHDRKIDTSCEKTRFFDEIQALGVKSVNSPVTRPSEVTILGRAHRKHRRDKKLLFICQCENLLLDKRQRFA
jgi:hypothetical protein